jgi:2-keto-4-pentenoate hydratase/2-oxohepta-3-ene-1,7-dioic acid hydratase in catechol pathway
MKLVRHGSQDHERPGLIDGAGGVRDLSAHLPDIGPQTLSPEALGRLRAIDPETLPPVPADTRLGAPLSGVGKIVAFGLNYVEHAREANLPLPVEPTLFMKAASAINGPNDDVVIPPGSEKTDWEVELGIVIGRRATAVTEAQALDHVAGYMLVNDVSERAFQFDRGGTWDKGKSCDTFCPLGPWFVTADEIVDPLNLDLWLEVNGERMQTGNTSDMIAGPARLVSHASQFMTLHPGDIVITGTPAGVGMGQTPPRFLALGDVVSLGVTGLGVQRQRFVAGDPR